MTATNKLTRFQVIKPAMEGTLQTTAVDDFSSNSKVCSHMLAVGIQGMSLSLLISGHYDIVTSNVYSLGVIAGQFMTSANDVPSIGEGGNRFPYVFLLGVVVAFHIDNCISNGPLVEAVEDEEGQSGGDEVVLSDLIDHLRDKVEECSNQLHFNNSVALIQLNPYIYLPLFFY